MTETHRRSGYVALLGRPNVGKSTLLNRWLGQALVITSHKPQTTRHAILGIKTSAQGQMLLIDTPGIHRRGEGALNRYLNRTARSVLHQADVILLVVEALRWTAEDDAVLQDLAGVKVPVVAAVNKIDRIPDRKLLLPFLERLSHRFAFHELVPVSAARGEQLEVLDSLVSRLLPLREPLYPEDQLSDRPERFFAAELLREQLTRRYAKELPYQLSVEIERFEEEPRRHVIHALIWVERPGQKAILIGKDGAALREAATQARLRMREFFGRPVHLEVWVKVHKSWSSDESALARLGYSER
jgi:GTPase